MSSAINAISHITTSSIITAQQLKERYPVSKKIQQAIVASQNIISNIVHLKDPRLLVITWPCSIHDTELALEIAKNLVKLKEQYPHIYPVMRVYFEKPRTTVGWKWLINDPHLDGTYDIQAWLEIARKLLLDINALWLPTATEFLDMFSPQYISDLVHWWAIWARTTESQPHRELASGLLMPIWFKNGTSWDIDVAIDAILSSQRSHTFLWSTQEGIAKIVKTRGNEDGHIILRWWSQGPNYTITDIISTSKRLEERWIETWIIIDASHANSQKDHNKQQDVVRNVADQIQRGNKKIMWIMLESNKEAGKQNFVPWIDSPATLKYGQSITDACISLEKNQQLLHILNKATQIRDKNANSIPAQKLQDFAVT